MNLNQAIQKIINDSGADILKRKPFIDLLTYYNAFGQMPYAENMLNQIYANGYGTKIYKLYCNKDKSEVEAFISEMHNKFGFDVEKFEKVLYAFSLPVQRRNKKNQQKTRGSETNIEQEYEDQPETPSLDCEITVKPVNISHQWCDEEDIISVGDRFRINSVRYICLQLVINSHIWETIEDIRLEVRLQTANNDRDVWDRYINLCPGKTDCHTKCFGNGSGNYFGLGTSTFYIYLNNQFICKHSINMEEGKGLFQLLFN